MPKKTHKNRFDLPPLELRCLTALWSLGKATVQEIRTGLVPEHHLAYTTVMTVMDRLSRKGMVQRAKHGRAHLYRPAVTQEIIREHALNQLVENFFQGSREGLRRHLGSAPITSRKSGPKKIMARGQPGDRVIPATTNTKHKTEIDTSLL